MSFAEEIAQAQADPDAPMRERSREKPAGYYLVSVEKVTPRQKDKWFGQPISEPFETLNLQLRIEEGPQGGVEFLEIGFPPKGHPAFTWAADYDGCDAKGNSLAGKPNIEWQRLRETYYSTVFALLAPGGKNDKERATLADAEIAKYGTLDAALLGRKGILSRRLNDGTRVQKDGTVKIVSETRNKDPRVENGSLFPATDKNIEKYVRGAQAKGSPGKPASDAF